MKPSRFDRRQPAPVWVVEIDVKRNWLTGQVCAEMVDELLMSDAMVHKEPT